MNFTKVLNDYTKQNELHGFGTLVSISEKVLNFANENKTEYRPSTLTIVNNLGVSQNIQALVLEKQLPFISADGSDIKPGTQIPVKIVRTTKGNLLCTSRLQSGVAMSDDFFDEI